MPINIKDRIRKYFPFRRNFSDIQVQLSQILWKIEKIQESLGRIESRQISDVDIQEAKDAEFQVYSQWGEDGIIQYLIRNIAIDHEIFVEIGVEDYTECNTRFLLLNNAWSGLAIEGSKQHVDKIRLSREYWLYNLKVAHAFVTTENINDLLEGNGLKGEIGLLSIDIDGNDYWIWEAITVINPVIVVIEYNHRFGKEKALTVPYEETFVREQKHYSTIYYGASLSALYLLGQRKGYELVGCSSSGVNAFFVRKDKLPRHIHSLTPDLAYKAGHFSDYKDEFGQRIKSNLDEEVDFLCNKIDMPLIEIDKSCQSNANVGSDV